MCTQLTYEGLVDEVLRINNSSVEIPNDADPERPSKARLNSSDVLFKELRDLNFGRACDILRERSSAMQQDYKNIKVRTWRRSSSHVSSSHASLRVCGKH